MERIRPYTKEIKLKDLSFAVTGHSSGIGKTIFDSFNCKGFSRSNGYDICDTESRKKIIQESKECDVFVNCAFDLYSQIDLLYELNASFSGSTIVNISSNSGDGIKNSPHRYASIKTALDKASEQLFYYKKKNIINLRPGYVDTPRVNGIESAKLSTHDVVEVMCFCLYSDFSVKEITFLKK